RYYSNPNKSEKEIWVVFDAAATMQGVSLNSQLYMGPDILRSLVGTLFKLRQRNFGFCGDIKVMFLRIKIRTACPTVLVTRQGPRERTRPSRDDVHAVRSFLFTFFNSASEEQKCRGIH